MYVIFRDDAALIQRSFTDASKLLNTDEHANDR